MNDDDLTRLLRAWLSEPDGLPAPRIEGVASLTHLPPQQHGWLPPLRVRRWLPIVRGSKLVMVAAIVALVAGLSLTGAVQRLGDGAVPGASTVTPSPSMTDELLSRVVTEEVEPGLLRVVSDGVRDLSSPLGPGDYGMRPFQMAVGYDGSVWVFWPDAFFRLGDPDTYDWGDQPDPSFLGDIEVAPDGTLWRAVEGSLWSFDGVSWSAWERPGPVYGVEVEADGSVWVASTDAVGRYDGADWTDYEVPGGGSGQRSLTVSADGVVWVEPGDGSFNRLDGQSWLRETPPVGERSDQPVVAGPGGTLWARQWPNLGTNVLALLDENGWTVYDRSDGVPVMTALYDGPGPMAVAPDGKLWVMPNENEWCGGLASFDRTVWTRYAQGTCVFTFAISPDGAVWLQGSDALSGPAETYVIRPGGMPDPPPSALERPSSFQSEPPAP